eukprot:GHVO01061046.1.p1 GENE.GHVO01061046.1~~GHVO01061046.1.p1  ORF type:complete len:117 (+),score=3.11 GHVO01061046.1:45-395(+)
MTIDVGRAVKPHLPYPTQGRLLIAIDFNIRVILESVTPCGISIYSKIIPDGTTNCKINEWSNFETELKQRINKTFQLRVRHATCMDPYRFSQTNKSSILALIVQLVSIAARNKLIL